jgi:AraC-like DNA-binding protein
MTDETTDRIRVDERGHDLTAARATLASAYAGVAWSADRTAAEFSYRYAAAGDASMTLRAVQFAGLLSGEMPDGDDYVVQWITRGTGVLDLGRREIHLEPGRPQMWPNEAFQFAFEDYDQRLVQVNRQLVADIGAERGLDTSAFRFDHTAEPDAAAMRRWRQTIHLISSTTMDRAASPLLQVEMGRLAAASLLELYPQQRVTLPEGLLLPRNAHLRTVVEYVHENAHLPITTSDLARLAGLSLRSLQEGFRRHLGTTPNSYLRGVRLDRIHAELLHADPVRTNVAQVARYWGFAHAGRFSAAYAERFGEYPSATLRG